MIITIAVDNGDNTAYIDGWEDRDPKASWSPTPGYVYLNGMYDGTTQYAVLQNGVWTVADRPAFHVLAGEYAGTVGQEIVFDLKEANAEVFLDEVSQGVNAEETVSFTPDTIGVFVLEFKKWPFQELKVIVNAT